MTPLALSMPRNRWLFVLIVFAMLVGGSSLVPLGGAKAATTPVVGVSPSSGARGDFVTISGVVGECPAGSTQATIYVLDVQAVPVAGSYVVAAPDGSFSATFIAFPATTPVGPATFEIAVFCAGAVSVRLPSVYVDATASNWAVRSSTAPACTTSATLVPSCGAWFGVAANPLTTTQTWDQSLLNFESTTGRGASIYHVYKKDGQLFPSAGEIARAREIGRKRLMLINWKPSTTLTWRQVANGSADGTIDSEAAYLKANFKEKFFLTIWHEMESKVNQTSGSGLTAQDFHDMYRHVVLRLRADGVTNAVTVVNYLGSPYWGSQSWFATLYPGDDVVDWIAEDPYSFGGSWLVDFAGNANRTEAKYANWPGFYRWAVARNKPIMLAEYGVDDPVGKAAFKPNFFANEVAQLKAMPGIKAVVYWSQNTFSPVGTTRVDSSPGSLAAYRSLGADSYVKPAVP